MGQGDILDVIENSKVPLTAREVADKLLIDEFKACKHLRTLLINNEIMCIELDRHLSLKFLNSKRRTRLYYT